MKSRRWWVYMLRCRDGSLYTRATTEVARRLGQHQAGTGGAYTAAHRPVTLAYTEAARNRSSALRREAALKRWPRAQKLALIAAQSGGRGMTLCSIMSQG